jgi:hypothetical protein
MTRALTTRLAKLEARRRMHDEDVSRLSTAELEALQKATMLEIIAQHGGTIKRAVETLGQHPDPECVAFGAERHQMPAQELR